MNKSGLTNADFWIREADEWERSRARSSWKHARLVSRRRSTRRAAQKRRRIIRGSVRILATIDNGDHVCGRHLNDTIACIVCVNACAHSPLSLGHRRRGVSRRELVWMGASFTWTLLANATVRRVPLRLYPIPPYGWYSARTMGRVFKKDSIRSDNWSTISIVARNQLLDRI